MSTEAAAVESFIKTPVPMQCGPKSGPPATNQTFRILLLASR